MATTLGAIERKISKLLKSLGQAGPMRPGTLSIQYRNPGQKKIPFHQLSYTFKGKSRSEYVRPDNLASVEQELRNYKKFQQLVNTIIELSLEASRLRHKNPNPVEPETGQ